MESVQETWERFRESIGFIPAILVVGAIALAFGMVTIDQVYFEEVRREVPWLFGGTADAARGLLSTIAGAMITVVSISFSVTIVALQQASSQYSPRVLRTFTSDKLNQIVLGMYIATFVYALLVLRSVRTEVSDIDGSGFVPALSVVVAIILALICLGLLIVFIHRITQSLQVAEIIRRVHGDLVQQIEVLYPEQIGEPVADPASAVHVRPDLERATLRTQFVLIRSGLFVMSMRKRLLGWRSRMLRGCM